jgi:hypothetical protein
MQQVLNQSKWTKNEEDMGLEFKRALEFIFLKIEANYHSSSSFLLCVAPLFFLFKENL